MIPKRVYAEIDLDAIRHNISQMKNIVGKGVQVMAVIKANGYGHGAVSVAQALKGLADGFCVATAEEALDLRQSGITAPILILGYVFPEELSELIQNDIALTVFDTETAEEISALAGSLGKTANIHIKLDTGMGRIGFLPNKISVAAVKEISEMPYICIEGLFSHFACADEKDKTSAKHQRTLFCEFSDALQKTGVTIKYHHLCNSAGITELPDARFNMVRCGIATYGLYPSDEVDRSLVELHPAMSIYSHVVYVKTVPAGTTVSYGSTFVADREMTIATIPVGYADGLPRSLSGKGYMMIKGQKAPILGRVCMDQCMVDVSQIDGVCRGDKVTVMGDGIDAETLQNLSGRLHYEIICDISDRVKRIYIGKIKKNRQK